MQHVWRFVVSIIKESDLKVTSVISSKSHTIYFNYHPNAQVRVLYLAVKKMGTEDQYK